MTLGIFSLQQGAEKLCHAAAYLGLLCKGRHQASRLITNGVYDSISAVYLKLSKGYAERLVQSQAKTDSWAAQHTVAIVEQQGTAAAAAAAAEHSSKAQQQGSRKPEPLQRKGQAPTSEGAPWEQGHCQSDQGLLPDELRTHAAAGEQWPAEGSASALLTAAAAATSRSAAFRRNGGDEVWGGAGGAAAVEAGGAAWRCPEASRWGPVDVGLGWTAAAVATRDASPEMSDDLLRSRVLLRSLCKVIEQTIGHFPSADSSTMPPSPPLDWATLGESYAELAASALSAGAAAFDAECSRWELNLGSGNLPGICSRRVCGALWKPGALLWRFLGMLCWSEASSQTVELRRSLWSQK
ncbi:MAG: hypothetical protein FRX49_03151 [Trebouxia sp. A1-2]|nr:MAG: hypothetical protein FRX49_03151 [Trebouxia sp. A1-2]